MAKKINNTSEEVKETKKPAKTSKAAKSTKTAKPAKVVEPCKPVEEPVKEVKPVSARNYDFDAQLLKIEKSCMDFNEAFLDKDFDKVNKLNAAITEYVNEYTGEALNKCLRECAAAEDPMLEAVTRLTFDTVGVKDNKDNDSGIITKEVVKKFKQIDLMKLHKMCGGIGYDKNWVYELEKFNQLLTLRWARELKIPKWEYEEISTSYLMKEASSKIVFLLDNPDSDVSDPVSNRNLLKTLNILVKSMIGPDFKAHSQDLAYLLSIYTKKSGKELRTVVASKHNAMRNYMAEICNTLIRKEHYHMVAPIIKK